MDADDTLHRMTSVAKADVSTTTGSVVPPGAQT